MKYNLVQMNDGNEANLTVVHDGEMFVATDSHPNFQRIVSGLVAGDESVVELFDVQKTAQRRFDRLSERVTISNGKVFLDGEETDNALTQQVINFIDNGVEDFKPLIAFFEKIETNQNAHSREQLYTWLRDRNITLTEDGNFIAYKGVRVGDRDESGAQYFSISTGKAISNGVEYDGPIPNPIGAVVEMPRSEVQHDPSVGCHVGLHAGTWNYASDFAQGAVLTVEINPRDVVSVPTDCFAQKLRVCRYVVKDVTETELSSPVYPKYQDYDVDEYDDLGYDYDPDYDDDESASVEYEVKEATESTGVVVADVSSAITWRPTESAWAPEDPEAPWNQ